ncbi:UNVERIFIED_CONTAM: Transposon Tf2-11 polyprotein [Sesamum indicum]
MSTVVNGKNFFKTIIGGNEFLKLGVVCVLVSPSRRSPCASIVVQCICNLQCNEIYFLNRVLNLLLSYCTLLTVVAAVAIAVVAAVTIAVVAAVVAAVAIPMESWIADDQWKPPIRGEERTYALVQRAYYWPQMRDDVETYVRTCLICQQDKADHQKKASLLQPLPIPKRPWESVSMDYISGLPKVGDLGSIIVVVDRLSKYTTFIAAPKHVTAEGTAHLFFKHIVKYWGLPKDIVSDRDSGFTGVFWTELFKILGSKLSMSSSYHP